MKRNINQLSVFDRQIFKQTLMSSYTHESDRGLRIFYSSCNVQKSVYFE